MDIVEQLRLVDITFWFKPLGGGVDTELDELGVLSHKAADEIERLRKKNEELLEIVDDLANSGYWNWECLRYEAIDLLKNMEKSDG